MSKKPYTPERAYRISVTPVAALLVINGTAIFIGATFSLMTITWVPLVDGEETKRLIMSILGVINVLFGFGFYMKSRVAWIAFFVYLAVGTAWMVAGAVYDPWMGQEADLAIAIAAAVFNSLLALGIYAATKPAFRKGAAGP